MFHDLLLVINTVVLVLSGLIAAVGYRVKVPAATRHYVAQLDPGPRVVKTALLAFKGGIDLVSTVLDAFVVTAPPARPPTTPANRMTEPED